MLMVAHQQQGFNQGMMVRVQIIDQSRICEVVNTSLIGIFSEIRYPNSGIWGYAYKQNI